MVFFFPSFVIDNAVYMASASTMKTFCTTCGNKGTGVFKCEGCQQTFCRKHANEHRDVLNHQLDEIVFEFDTLQQILAEIKDKINNHPLMQQIDQWEKESVDKIRQTANDLREQLNTLTGTSQGK